MKLSHEDFSVPESGLRWRWISVLGAEPREEGREDGEEGHQEPLGGGAWWDRWHLVVTYTAIFKWDGGFSVPRRLQSKQNKNKCPVQKMAEVGTRHSSEEKTVGRWDHNLEVGKRLLGTGHISVSLPEGAARPVLVPREVPDAGTGTSQVPLAAPVWGGGTGQVVRPRQQRPPLGANAPVKPAWRCPIVLHLSRAHKREDELSL